MHIHGSKGDWRIRFTHRKLAIEENISPMYCMITVVRKDYFNFKQKVTEGVILSAFFRGQYQVMW